MTSYSRFQRLKRLDHSRSYQASASRRGAEVASRAYNGTLCHTIRDVTKRDEMYVLTNSGNSYDIFSKDELRKSSTMLIEAATDRDEFLQWYNCHIL